MGDVSYALDGIDWQSTLSTATENGSRYYHVNAVCRLRPADEAGHMTMRILQGEKEVGKGELKLD